MTRTANGVFRNIFDEQVSVFAPSKDHATVATHHIRTIGQFLNAGHLYASNIEAVRYARQQACDAALRGDTDACADWLKRYRDGKWLSPYAILQGVCPTRKNEGFTRYSNVLCLDIDAPKPTESNAPNTWVNDWEQVKRDLSQFPWVAYCALSVGGQGLFVLVPIADAAHYGDYFKAVSKELKDTLNLDVDAQTCNLARLRYMTIDAAPYTNDNALVWDKILPVERVQHQHHTIDHAAPSWGGTHVLTEAEKNRVKIIVGYCLDHHVNVAESHDDWMRIAGFFAHHWDDAEGCSLFHELAALSPKYRVHENDRKLISMGRYHPQPATLFSFYHVCRSNGVPVPDEWMPQRNVGLYFPPVSPISRPVPGADTSRHDDECSTTEMVPVCDHAEAVTATPVPVLGVADAALLNDMQPAINQAYKNLSKIDGFREFFSTFDVFICGIGDWMMNDAQMAYTSATINKARL